MNHGRSEYFPTPSDSRVVAVAALAIQSRLAPDRSNYRCDCHGDGVIVSRFRRLAILCQSVLRLADAIRDRGHLRAWRHSILCDWRTGALVNPAPVGVVDGDLAAHSAACVRHFGSGHSALASTFWR